MAASATPPVLCAGPSERDEELEAPLLDAQGREVAGGRALLAHVKSAVIAADAGPRSADMPPADVPLVDIAPFLEPPECADPAARRSSLAAALRACRRLGFLSLAGHGVPPELLSEVRARSREFFALSAEEKLRCRGDSATSRGYHGLRAESATASLGRKAPADLKEGFDLGPPGPWPEANVMPPEELVPGFRRALEEYYGHMERLEAALLELFTAALAEESGRPLPRDWARRAIGRHRGLLRVNYYPRLAAGRGELRCSAHTDWDPFTILYAEREGLEVVQDGAWRRVPLAEGCFVVNVGDTLQRWSNGRFKSSIHRVNAEGCAAADRLSIPFFSTEALDPEDDSAAEPVVAEGDVPRYGPLCIRDYLARNFAALQGRPNAHAQRAGA